MTTITTIGRITRDFELKTGEKSGCVYANFSLAVNEGYGDSQKATYFECTAFGADAERLVKAKAKKGSLIQVTGKFSTSEFVRTNGDPGYSLKIIVLAWDYIPVGSSKKDSNGDNGADGSAANDDNGQASDLEFNPSEEDFVMAMSPDGDDEVF